MSNPSLCGKINLVKEAKELYTVNEETLQTCNLNQKVSFYLEIEKLALRFIWKYKGPRVVFQLLWLYNKLPQNFIHRAKQSLLYSQTLWIRNSDRIQLIPVPYVCGFSWKNYKQASGIIYYIHTYRLPCSGLVWASLQHGG